MSEKSGSEAGSEGGLSLVPYCTVNPMNGIVEMLKQACRLARLYQPVICWDSHVVNDGSCGFEDVELKLKLKRRGVVEGGSAERVGWKQWSG